MIPRRSLAAVAAVLTVLILQATVLTPLTAPLAVSLPAVLVAVIGTELGVSAGIAAGFSTGLLADLGSQHPAGVLALAWLILGGGCGLLATPRRRPGLGLTVVSLAVGSITLLSAVALALLDAPASSLSQVGALAVPTTLVDAALVLLVRPAVRMVARALRVGRPAVRSRPGVGPAGRLAADG